MHPLLQSVTIMKNKLLNLEEGGICLDIFTLPNDMQIYSSSNFSKVLCVALTEQEMKYLIENSPTRPSVRIGKWNLYSKYEQTYFDSFIVFSDEKVNISCVWIYLYRSDMNDSQFEHLIQIIYNRSTTLSKLYIFGVDRDIASQYVMSNVVYTDKQNNMIMHYHKQSIKTISLNSVINICYRNGFIMKNVLNGQDIIRETNVNCLPYDLWISQTFFLIELNSKFHFKRDL